MKNSLSVLINVLNNKKKKFIANVALIEQHYIVMQQAEEGGPHLSIAPFSLFFLAVREDCALYGRAKSSLYNKYR